MSGRDSTVAEPAPKDPNVIIHPLWFNGLDGTCYADMDDPRRPVNVDQEVLLKRFKDTELAAEYWHAMLQASTKSHSRMVNIATIERFATTPGYDDCSRSE